MNLAECIESRRSVRKYQDKKIDRKILEQLVCHAAMAPSGSNNQIWEFVVVDDEEILDKMVAYSPGIVKRPPCIIALCADMEKAEKKGGRMGARLAGFDISMAAENLILSAVDQGIGSCAIASFAPEIMQRILKLPENIEPKLLVTLGYPDGEPKCPPKRELADLLHFNTWE